MMNMPRVQNAKSEAMLLFEWAPARREKEKIA
jgi:hypothetical protein